jgi:hypothetical protein
MAAQAPHEYGVDARAFTFQTLAQVCAQMLGLLMAQWTEPIVIVFAKRGLAVAHKVERSHAGIV